VTSRERILTAISHEEPDRVPVWFAVQAGIRQRLFEYFGVDDTPVLLERLGCDAFGAQGSWVHPEYRGPERLTMPDGSQADHFGIVIQKHWPLAFAQTVADLESYSWPRADWFDYSTVKERCLAAKERDMVTIGGEGSCGIYHAINLRGYQLALTDPYLCPDLAEAYMQRMGDFMVEWNDRWLDAAEGEFDLFRCGDEVGNSQTMLLRPEIWRKFYKPQLSRVWSVARRKGIKVYYHCCGCLRPVFEDLLELGVDLWDTAPPYVDGNDLAEMKRLYGDRVTFVGGVDQPFVLYGGTPREVEDEVRLRLDQLAPGGGLLLGHSQAITDDCPLENVLAMYETARKYGEYR